MAVELHPAQSKPPISRLRGVLYRPGRKPATIEEMQDAIEAVEL